MADAAYALVIGTTNVAKGRELAELLAPHGFVVKTLKDFPPQAEVEEHGTTFAENARTKASEYARRMNAWVLADDSGLEVAALDGRPGVYSARYAGKGAGDAANNALLLKELGDLPPTKRGARYYCHVAVADPHGEIRAESADTCSGRIRTAPSGSGGFGYDPLFEIVELHQTFGELGPHVKAALSHRGRAMRAIVPKLAALAASGAWHAQT
jgi:XTP/dITP diphosphohydrolase